MVKAVFKQFGGGGYGSGLADEAELNQHQKLEKLYISTRAAKVVFLKLLTSLKF
jgi:N-methylhydantoinase B/oxoprolinase/acetone carboxylase alpha subunit